MMGLTFRNIIIFAFFIAVIGLSPAYAKQHALLVGVGNYHVSPLSGPVNDVRAMERVLIENWGFNEKDIKILLNKDGTRKNILSSIENLYEVSKPNDEIFIYLSGHGTSSSDMNMATPLPTTTGAFIPIDVAGVKSMKELMGRLIIGKRDLRPLLTKLDKGNRNVFVAIDACYSGNTVRGAYGKKQQKLPERFLKVSDLLPKRAFGDDLDLGDSSGWDEAESGEENNYPYKNIYYLSASGEHEPAQDIPQNMVINYPTIDAKPHGAFTDTLLRVLNGKLAADSNGDGNTTYAEVKKVIRDNMRTRGFNHTPQGLPSLAEDKTNLSSKAMFGYHFIIPAKSTVAIPTNPVVVAGLAKTSDAIASVPVSSQPFKKPVNNNAQQKPTASIKIAPSITQVLRVKIDGELKNVRKTAHNMLGIQVVGNDATLEIRPDDEDIIFVSRSGDLVSRLQGPSEDDIYQHLQYQVWINKFISQKITSDFSVDVEMYGSGRGNTAIDGELIGFSIRASESAYILLIDIDSKGNVNVIYPYTESELEPVSANTVLALKNVSKVTPPYGRDYLQVFAFNKSSSDYVSMRGRSFSLGSPFADRLNRLIQSKDFVKAKSGFELITASRF